MPWETPLHYSYLLFSLNCIECLLLVEHQNFSLCTVRFLGRDLHAQWPNGQISVSAEGGHADEWTNAVFLLLQSWLEVPSQTERAGETEEEKLQVCISSFHCGTTSSGGGGKKKKKEVIGLMLHFHILDVVSSCIIDGQYMEATHWLRYSASG